jgi:membrane-associated phospholipid phosphatase
MLNKPLKPISFLRARLSPDGYLSLHLTIGMAVVLLAVFVFANIAEDLVERDSLVMLLDEHVMQWLQAHATPGRTAFFLFVTHWHNTLGVVVMTTLLALWLAYKRSWDWMLRVLLSIPLGMLLNVLLKSIFQRQRPVFDHPLLSLVTYSFPSGHTAAATLFYGVLAAWLVAVLQRRWHAPVVVLATAMVALVASSRVYLGAHYPSDVFAAMASSTAWLAVVFTGVSTWRKRQDWIERLKRQA